MEPPCPVIHSTWNSCPAFTFTCGLENSVLARHGLTVEALPPPMR